MTMNVWSRDVQTELAVIHVCRSLEQCNELLRLVQGWSVVCQTAHTFCLKNDILILCIDITHKLFT